jgi:hypothetical protein
MRSSPSLDGRVLAKCRKGEPVKYLTRSLEQSRIGNTLHYWFKVANQKGTSGWIYGRYVSVLYHDTPGNMGILRDLIQREFTDLLFKDGIIFHHFQLETDQFLGKDYFRFNFQYTREGIVTCGTSLFRKQGDRYIKLAEAPCRQTWYFFDFEKDGFAEIVALDESKRSVFVYSEKTRREIFQYALYAQGKFEITDDTHGSYIEVVKTRANQACEIVVHTQESDYHPMQKTVYRWNGQTFFPVPDSSSR